MLWGGKVFRNSPKRQDEKRDKAQETVVQYDYIIPLSPAQTGGHSYGGK